MKDTIQGRVIGIMVAEGSDRGQIDKLIKEVMEIGVKIKFVAPKIGDIKLSDGSILKVDGQLAGTPSVLFDAVAIILSDTGALQLSKEAAALEFVRDAFGHLKAIGLGLGAKTLFEKAGLERDKGVVDLSNLSSFLELAKGRQWEREATVRTLP